VVWGAIWGRFWGAFFTINAPAFIAQPTEKPELVFDIEETDKRALKIRGAPKQKRGHARNRPSVDQGAVHLTRARSPFSGLAASAASSPR
jgi:hypothetical protein